MADIGSSTTALIALAGTSFGVVVGFAGQFFVARATTERERESRREARRDAAKQRQNETQAEVLLTLQDALVRLINLGRVLHSSSLTEHSCTGVWKKGHYPAKLEDATRITIIKVMKLLVRALDERLRDNVTELILKFHTIYFAENKDEAQINALALEGSWEETNELVGELLRALEHELLAE